MTLFVAKIMKNQKTIFEDKSLVLTSEEIAEKIHMHPQTIRNWEKKGLIKSVETNRYTGIELGKIEEIIRYKEEGLNLTTINYILNERN